MKIFTIRKGLIAALTFGALVLEIGVYAATNVTIADGVYANFGQFGGPAATRMRTLTIDPGEVLGWHNHPGVGAYTIVKQGTLTVEDGCGFETVYTQGQAFLEHAGRVHRGKNLTGEPVITAQTFIVPLGTPYTIDTGQVCGRPLKVDECKQDGWKNFNYPRTFDSQGDCVSTVLSGLRTPTSPSTDFDGDGRTDLSVFRPSDGTWYVMQSGSNTFRAQPIGQNGDKIVPGDYDGDGRTDFAVFRQTPQNGVWYVLRSSDNAFYGVDWGLNTDKPVPGDYDGDGKTDIAVYRDGTWYIVQSSNGQFTTQQFGAPDDIPVAAANAQ